MTVGSAATTVAQRVWEIHVDTIINLDRDARSDDVSGRDMQ